MAFLHLISFGFSCLDVIIWLFFLVKEWIIIIFFNNTISQKEQQLIQVAYYTCIHAMFCDPISMEKLEINGDFWWTDLLKHYASIIEISCTRHICRMLLNFMRLCMVRIYWGLLYWFYPMSLIRYPYMPESLTWSRWFQILGFEVWLSESTCESELYIHA